MRKLIVLACWLGIFVAAWVSAQAQSVSQRPELYHEALRPQFHFSARYFGDYRLNPGQHQEGWVNDVNGLVYNQGEYHLFAQRWWSCWLHAVSTDLVHWQELEPAFGKGGKFGGTQSGGAVVDHQNTSGLGRGGEPPMLAFWSSTDNRNQCMSYSQDKGRTWVKYENNPVLSHPFRDPNVFWYEPGKKWVMVLYGPMEDESASRGTYGFNGESNDAHDLLEYAAGDWQCSVVRLGDDGRVVVSDAAGQAEKQIDIKRQQVSDDGFYVGAKTGNSEFLDGEIVSLLVYDRTLSDEESTRLGNVVRSKEGPDVMARSANLEVPRDGLVLHLDASEVEVDDSGKVLRWKDLSGNHHDMVQSLAERRPRRVDSAIGDRPAIRFHHDQFLKGDAVLAEGDDSLTIVALWRRDHLDGSAVICEQDSNVPQTGKRAALLAQGRSNQPENCYLFFESSNLLQWKKFGTSIPGMYECPDMFPLLVDGDEQCEKWVVIDGSGDYLIGSFDGEQFHGESSKRKGDFGRNFYATMSFSCMPEHDKRRVQMAWMRGGEYPDMPFNQQISFPCELTLRTLPEGIRMCRNPVKEIEKLHSKEFKLHDFVLKPGANPIGEVAGELFDITVDIDVSQSDCKEIIFDLMGNTVSYDCRTRRLDSCGSRVTLEPRDGHIQIRMLVDRMSVETFGNHGEVSVTNVVKAQRSKSPLSLRAIDGEAKINRLAVHELNAIWE